MENAPLPHACKQCGRTDAKPIAKKFDFLPGLGPWNSDPVATTYTYQCACGAAFTQTVRRDGQHVSDAPHSGR